MDRPRRNDQLAVNKIGKKIRKNDFRNIVQQPTCSTKPQNSRFQKIRPAALTDVPPPAMAQPTHNLARPPMHPLPLGSQPMMGHGDQFWSNITAESHVSVNMPSIQSSLGDSGRNGNQMQPSHQYQSHNHHSPRFNGSSRDKPILPSTRLNGPPQLSLPSLGFNGRGILPSPVSVHIPSLQSSFGDSVPNRNQVQPSHEYQAQLGNHHSPRFNGSASSVPILPSPRFNSPPQHMYDKRLPCPRFNDGGILPSPTSQYLLQSSTAYGNMLSPRGQYPPPLRPTSFTLSSMAQPGVLGPGKFPQPPASPGLVFPPSPFGEFTN